MSATETITSPLIESLQARLDELAHLDADATIATPCWKCDGRGYGGWVLDGGRCWNCNATGTKTRVVRNVRASLRQDITLERKSIVEVARRKAEREAHASEFAAAHADLVEALQGRDGFDFLGQIAATLASKGRLTENQVEAARKALAREAERKAAEEAAEPVPTGQVEVTGLVVSTKTQEGYYGSTTFKMLVLDDRGFKVYGTNPSKLDARKGDRVSFVATLERSGDDPKFGFFSRPSKCRMLEEAPEEE